MSQRDKASKKAAERHGSTQDWARRTKWRGRKGGRTCALSEASHKHHKEDVKGTRRAQRRLDKEIVKEEMMSDYLEEPKNPGLDDGKCGVCGEDKGLTEEDRCHGCGYLICDAHFGDPWGKHLVVQHDDEEE